MTTHRQVSTRENNKPASVKLRVAAGQNRTGCEHAFAAERQQWAEECEKLRRAGEQAAVSLSKSQAQVADAEHGVDLTKARSIELERLVEQQLRKMQCDHGAAFRGTAPVAYALCARKKW